MKKYIKLNNNDNHLSWGNVSRIIKYYSINKTSALQTEIFATIFGVDTVNDTTVNNYCVGCRTINNEYKETFIKYKNKYNKNKNILIPTIINLLSIIDGNIYFFDNEQDSLIFINDNKNLRNIIKKLYNIGKNDKEVPRKLIQDLNNYISNSNLYEAICNILFFAILEKKQPIYDEDLKKQVIENILNNTTISTKELENYLNLKFTEGINYNYHLKNLAKENNAYACFELGMNEYKGYISGYPRYDNSYEYFYKASLSNHPTAMFMIAFMYINKLIGSGHKQELNIAYDYLKKAINKGSIAALNTLGLMYLNGIYPLEKDKDKAIYYFEKAANHNYAYAYNNLGKIKEQEHDYKQAFNYYLESANLGESWACNKIGEFYRTGTFVKKDLEKAFKYYNLAINVEINCVCSYAYYNLAKYYYLEGCLDIVKTKNKNKAKQYFEIAANKKNIPASIELIYLETEEYLDTKNEKTLIKIKDLAHQIEQSPLYNNNIKNEIEQNLIKIKNHQNINLDIIINI